MFAAAVTAALLIAAPTLRPAAPNAKTLASTVVEIDGVQSKSVTSAKETKASEGSLQEKQNGSAKSARSRLTVFLALKFSSADPLLANWWKSVVINKPDRKSVSVVSVSNNVELERTNYYHCLPVSYFKKGAGAEAVLGCEKKEKKKSP